MKITSEQLYDAYDQIGTFVVMWQGDDFEFCAFNAWEDWKSRHFSSDEYKDAEAFDLLDDVLRAYCELCEFDYLDKTGTYRGEDATYIVRYDEDGEPLEWDYKPEIIEAKEAAEKKVKEAEAAVYSLVWSRKDAERLIDDEDDNEE